MCTPDADDDGEDGDYNHAAAQADKCREEPAAVYGRPRPGGQGINPASEARETVKGRHLRTVEMFVAG